MADPYGLELSGLAPELQPQAAALVRRQRIADAMLQQSQQAISPNRMAGGYVVPISPFEGAAKMLQAYSANKLSGRGEKDSEALIARQRQGVGDAMMGLQGRMDAAGTPAQPEQPVAEGLDGPPRPAQAAMPATPDARAAIIQSALVSDPYLRNNPILMAQYQQQIKSGENERKFQQESVWRAQESQLQREARMQERILAVEAQAQNQNLAREQKDQLASQAADLKRELLASQQSASATMARLTASLRPAPAPIVQTDEAGNVRLYDHQGGNMRELGKVGKPSASNVKQSAANAKTQTDLATTIKELEDVTKDGGLIDQSTGSGAGSAVDAVSGFFGHATKGAVAVGRMAPIFDMALKMVPRFEGPQSDKDTASYKEAAGNLANPSVPVPQKKAAAKEILRLMKQRQNQFVHKDVIGTEADTGAGAGAKAGAVLRFDGQGNQLP